MKVTGVRVWETRTYIYTREECLTVGAEASAVVDDGDNPNDVIESLFTDHTTPSLKLQVKLLAQSDKLFRLARRAERPVIIKRYERIIERRDDE